MIYEGNAFKVKRLEDGIAEFQFDLDGESVNKFSQAAVEDLSRAIDAVEADSRIKGAVLTSGKEAFVVGADITEFLTMFGQPDDVLRDGILKVNEIFSRFEDLPMPTVTAINGLALGGGFEICLCADYRVMSSTAKVGLPEVKLGIYPGWGGTVRLPRLIGADNAIEWICTGKEHKADDALKVGAVDAVIAPEKLLDAAVTLVKKCLSGELDFNARKSEKKEKLKLANMEAMMVFETAKPFVASKAGPHYPAPVEAVKTIQKHAYMGREKALEVEAKGFVKMAKTPVTESLVGLFLNDQLLKKKAKAMAPLSTETQKAAVLGAGIMGGGIAYQSAYKGTPVLMKDINQSGIDLGLGEAQKLLGKQVDRGRIDSNRMGEVLNSITPTLSYGDFKTADVVVEAVVENLKVKQSVLAETESHLNDGAVLASNTSTISITKIATALKSPEKFCGMHFFNPVHRMPLVEVIRGEKTNDATIATVVHYARKMGKTPVVVNDCPGFLVNRVLFPYFGGFAKLVKDGADFQQIDKVMEKFGWPMGPAYLLDVVGMDTAHHAEAVMAEGYPERMQKTFTSAVDVMFEQKRFGQKTDKGFYQYVLDKKGKQKKQVDEAVYNLLSSVSDERNVFEDDEIVARMMIPLCLETVRALEEGIVDSAAEADMALVMGIGFPPFHGGALKYLDRMGLAAFVTLADKYAHLGPLYQPTDKLREMAQKGEVFYQ
ncbi:fatty acid oxidation complex subunit alpha FadB [Candidatus Sororendozoicomonas aggregata]|uniref:fatty acid oxidation complex subunit alpha FadB n=1 Tax=Candidatus Sororendozoicomonas aggregata TaxID=3073239 RepID=UPI002ED2B395